MDNNSNLKQRFRGLLWGYPDLVKNLFDVVGPALLEIREKREREKEEAEQQDMTIEQVGNHNLHLAPEVLGLDNHASVPPQLSLHAPPNERSGPLDMTQSGLQADSQGETVHYPPISDEEHRLPTATSASMKALEPTPRVPDVPEPTSGDLILQPDIEEGDILPNEFDDKNERSGTV